MGKKLNLQWVSDVIGDDYKNWNKGDIVLINSQTGTGKTHFVKNTLLNALTLQKSVLFVCNRLNLKRQIKMDFLKKYKQPIPKTNKTLDKVYKVGNVTIVSYQAIENRNLDELYKIKEIANTTYDYYIFDECHYLCSDAMFNSHTMVSHSAISEICKNDSVKVFMTATFDDVLELVTEYSDNQNIKTYDTGQDYSYLDVKYFKKIKEISTMIRNDDSSDKWLVFVSKLEDADNLQKELGDIATVIKAGTDNKELDNIIKDSKFKCKVLITTKVLDNGVNIDDELVKNIVVMSWDKTTLKQEIGRVRIDIENARPINLYIATRYINSFTCKLRDLYKFKEEVDLYYNDNNAFCRKYHHNLAKLGTMSTLFYICTETNQIEVNQMGLNSLIKTIKYFENIANMFTELGKFGFVYEQLSWLGLEETFNEYNLITDVVLKEDTDSLSYYLDKLIGKKLDKDMQKELISRIDHKVDGHQQKSYNKLNIGLQLLKLPYVILSKRTNTNRYWIIEKNEY